MLHIYNIHIYVCIISFLFCNYNYGVYRIQRTQRMVL